MTANDTSTNPSSGGGGVFAHWPNRITMIRFFGALMLFAIFAVWGDVEREEIAKDRTVFCIAFWLLYTSDAADE